MADGDTRGRWHHGVVEPRVELLKTNEPTFDVVVRWHQREWSHGDDNANFEEWRSRLDGRCSGDTIPFTLVAYVEADPVGCLSVCHDDLDYRVIDRGPWLSGMFVVGSARNLGVGRSLLRVADQRAQAFGAPELWLHTSEAGPFYHRCGWAFAHRKQGPRDDAVMVRQLGTSTARATPASTHFSRS